MEKQSNAERLRRAEVLESEGYRQRLINQSEGERQGAINEAQGEAEAIRVKAQAEAESIRLIAEANADGLRAIGAAVQGPGGQDAMVQQLATRYVGQIGEMAKSANLVIVPDKPNDVSSVVATAMGVYGNISGKSADAMSRSNSALK